MDALTVGTSISKRKLDGNTTTNQKRVKGESAGENDHQEQSSTVRVKAAVSEDKGCRQAMEDVWVIEESCAADQIDARVAFFAILDGHGGNAAAKYAAEHLHKHVIDCGLLTWQEGSSGQVVDVKATKQAIVEGFKATDDALLKECASNRWQDGATAVAVWLVDNRAWIANVGDAKCVLARISEKEETKGQLKGLTLTKDHLAIYPAERARIQKAGGFISSEGRLNGRIQVSRSFGDAHFKQAGCCAVPDVMSFTISPKDRFLLLGCDGFWGVFDAQGAVEFAAKLLDEGREEKAVTNRIVNEAIRGRRCKDNCTCMIINFKHGPPADPGDKH